jgi:hypothetical protein
VNAKKWIGICKLEIWIRIEKHRGGGHIQYQPYCGVDGLEGGAHAAGVRARGEDVALVHFIHDLCELDACEVLLLLWEEKKGKRKSKSEKGYE